MVSFIRRGQVRKSGLLHCLVFLSILLAVSTVHGAGGSCSSYQPHSCSPPCDSSCSYYTFSGNSISDTIRQIPYALSALNPGGSYCDLEAESQLSSTMRMIPFTLGPYSITQLPYAATLRYKTYTQQTRTGPACPPPPILTP